MIQSSFTKAVKDYFGYLPGQNLSGFMAEVKALDAADREYFKKLFLTVGYEITSG